MNKLNTLIVLISQSFLSVLAQDDGVGSIRIIYAIKCKDSHGFYELSIEKCFSTLSNFKIRLCKHKCPSLWVLLGYFSETLTNLRVYLLPSKLKIVRLREVYVYSPSGKCFLLIWIITSMFYKRFTGYGTLEKSFA